MSQSWYMYKTVLWPNDKSLWVHRELPLAPFDCFLNPSILLVCHKTPWKPLCHHHSSRRLKLAWSLIAWILVPFYHSVRLPNNAPKMKQTKKNLNSQHHWTCVCSSYAVVPTTRNEKILLQCSRAERHGWDGVIRRLRDFKILIGVCGRSHWLIGK